jgi:acyl dehydratase
MTDPNQFERREPLYLEDMHVGLQFTTRGQHISEEQIFAFARQFDPQPFHLDPAAAQRSMFEGLVASGWHTAAVSMGLLVESGLPVAGGLIGAGGEITWPKPTRPGDTLHVEGEVIEVKPSRSRPDRGVVTLRNETRNQHGEIVQILIAKLVVPRRISPAASA